jgi:hypothetical protein
MGLIYSKTIIYFSSASDSRMGTEWRPRLVSLVAFAYLHNLTTRLNDGIFIVHRFSIATPARLRKSDFVFRFYVYGGTFDNQRGYFFLSTHGTVFSALCAYEYLDCDRTIGVLSDSVSDFIVGKEDYRLVVYREVGTIPRELLLGQGRVFSI